MRSYLTDAALRPQPKRAGPDDWTTPTDLVVPMIDYVLPLLPPGPIWECAPGSGVLVDALEAAGRTMIVTRQNFLTLAPPPGARIVLSNPPFYRLNEFIEHGFMLLDSGQLDAVSWLWRWDHIPTQLRVPWINRAFAVRFCWWRSRRIVGTTVSPRWTFAWVVWLANYPLVRNCCRTRRNNNRGPWMAFGHSIVDCLPIVRTIGRQ